VTVPTTQERARRIGVVAIAIACLVAAAAAGCRTAGGIPAPSIGADGVGLCPGSVPDSQQVADVVIADTSSQSPWLVQPLRVRVGPNYPPNARLGEIEADVVVSFIVDTAGHVVPRSSAIDRVRAWQKGPQSAAADAPPVRPFSEAVCEFVRKQRYAPVHLKSGGPPVRARLLVPFKFRVGSPD
jgi:hypothetical protein